MTVTKVRRLVNPYRPKARTKRRVARPKAKVKRNPASIITLGLVNPHKPATRRKVKRVKHIHIKVNPTKVRKGKTKMTAAKKKAFVARMKRARAKNPSTRRRRTRRATTHAAAPRRRRTARAANPRRQRTSRKNGTRIYVMKRNGTRRRVGRRNPEMFGMRGTESGKAILAGLVGVYATKTVGPMVANAIPSLGGSPIISAIISAAVAWGGGMLIGKSLGKTYGEGFMFGGLMQAGSQLLNLVVPANPLALSGLGDFVPAQFPVPQNPIRQKMLLGGATPGMGAAATFR